MYHSRLKKISLHVGTGRIRVKNGIEEGQSFSSDFTNFSVKIFFDRNSQFRQQNLTEVYIFLRLLATKKCQKFFLQVDDADSLNLVSY